MPTRLCCLESRTSPLVPGRDKRTKLTRSIGQKGRGAWGFNVGAEVAFFFSDNVGIGGGIRFTRATVAFENFINTKSTGETVLVDSDAGGAQVTAGVRLRFP